MRGKVDVEAVARKLQSEIGQQLSSPADPEWECGVVKVEQLRVSPNRAIVRGFDRAIRGQNAWHRERALSALAGIAIPECYRAVVGALGSDEPALRDYACQALGRMGLSDAKPHLMQRLADDDDDVRFSAIEALSYIPGGIEVGRLGILLNDKSELVRLAAVEAMVRWARAGREGHRVDRYLAAHAARERDPLVRCELLVWEYWRRGSKLTLSKLARLMSDQRGIVRWRAYESVPKCMSRPHLKYMLDVVSKRIRREHVANVKNLLRGIVSRLRRLCQCP